MPTKSRQLERLTTLLHFAIWLGIGAYVVAIVAAAVWALCWPLGTAVAH